MAYISCLTNGWKKDQHIILSSLKHMLLKTARREFSLQVLPDSSYKSRFMHKEYQILYPMRNQCARSWPPEILLQIESQTSK